MCKSKPTFGSYSKAQNPALNLAKSISSHVPVPKFPVFAPPAHRPAGTGGLRLPACAGKANASGSLRVLHPDVSAAHYAPNGALCGMSYYGWGAAQNISFNNRFQPQHWHVTSTPWGGNQAPPPCQPPAWTASWIDLAYNYVDSSSHNNGNVVKIGNNVNHAWAQNFTYDSLNRIATAQTDGTISSGAGNCWAETYTIDPWGNLLSNAPNPTTQSNYTGCIQEAPANLTGIVQTSNRLSGSGFTTDAAGNVIADGVHTFTFDAENHLLSTAQTGQTTVNYKYDGDSKRVYKSSGMLYWYGLGSEPRLETTLTGSPSFAYYYFNGRITNRRNWSHVLNLDTFVPDALGNTRLVSGLQPPSTGVWDYSDYYPYGGEWPHQTMCCVGNHYKFTGKERDSESNLDNFLARYYGSSLGRFRSPDWSPWGEAVPFADFSDPQSLNLYAYAANNPTNRIDLDGHDHCSGASGNDWESCKKNGGTWVLGNEKKEHQAPQLSEDEVRIYLFAREMNKRPVLKLATTVGGAGAVIGATGGTACYFLCSSLGLGGAITTLGTTGGTVGPLVTNPRLQKVVDWLFQATDKLPGGTAGAVTYEQKMGDLLSPAGHAQKAEDAIAALNRILLNEKLSLNDQITAKQMIQELRDALAAKPFGQNP